MSDAEFEALKKVAEDLKRRYNTPALATQLLQEEGILDSDGRLIDHFQEFACL